MKLLFDQNISYRILKKIEDIFPEAKHVKELKLDKSSDIEIWIYAKDNNFSIVTFDSDFMDLSILKGIPPKIIWLRLGNTSTNNIASIFRTKHKNIKEFLESEDSSLLELF
jgi:predicted nuclease of predicted toxin-antitoxin system